MKIAADEMRCIGATACLGPSMLELNTVGNKIRVLGDGHVPADEVEAVEDSVSFCPVSALRLEP
jgi:ferredoxin